MLEYFTFANSDSRNLNILITTRQLPTPDEQSLTDTIPYRQGTTDFSSLDGERFFNNRTITYTAIYKGNFQDRLRVEFLLKKALMSSDYTELVDSKDPLNTYWKAKCSSVTVSYTEGDLYFSVEIVFSARPFLYWSIPEGNDEWDSFNFDYDVSQDVSFDVDGADVICLINNGSDSIYPKLIVTGDITVTCNGYSVEFNTGTYTNTQIRLAEGLNSVKLTGSGSIQFVFNKEVMV